MSLMVRLFLFLLLSIGLFSIAAPAHARMSEAEREAYRTLRQLCEEQDAEAEETWEGLSRKEKKLVRERLVFEFESYPEPVPGVGEPWHCLARLAGLLDVKKAAPYVQRWEAGDAMAHIGQIALNGSIDGTGPSVNPVPERNLIQLIKNPSNSLDKKHQAQIALVNLDTRRSVRAWLDLRDAARAHPEAPEAQEQYTHREKIYEAYLMYHKYIPEFFGEDIHLERTPSAISNFAINVCEDYCTADIRVNHGPYEISYYRLCRHGDEWIISEYGGTVMA